MDLALLKGWVIKEASLKRFEQVHEIHELYIQCSEGTISSNIRALDLAG